MIIIGQRQKDVQDGDFVIELLLDGGPETVLGNFRIWKM